jgi:hypothetical protein
MVKVRPMAMENINNEIRALVEAWCDRREYGALSGLLPWWISNNGMTDGWAGLADALRHVSNYHNLPAHDRETLKRLWVELDTILRNR